MMKKLLVVLTVLAMATVANAGLKISVNGVADPLDSTINLMPSQWVELDVSSDGLTNAIYPMYLTVAGLGSFDIEHAGGWARNFVVPPGHDPDEELDNIFFINATKIFMDFVIPGLPVPILVGTAADRIWFHCDGQPGDVTLTLYGQIGQNPPVTFDTQIIHQIPEPITLALLGLGGLFLRRRK